MPLDTNVRRVVKQNLHQKPDKMNHAHQTASYTQSHYHLKHCCCRQICIKLIRHNTLHTFTPLPDSWRYPTHWITFVRNSMLSIITLLPKAMPLPDSLNHICQKKPNMLYIFTWLPEATLHVQLTVIAPLCFRFTSFDIHEHISELILYYFTQLEPMHSKIETSSSPVFIWFETLQTKSTQQMMMIS